MLDLIPAAVALLAAAGYGAAWQRLRRRGDRWPPGRPACFLAGSACAVVALSPPLASYDDIFPGHVGQHLLLGMAGPALLALSAPVTLALRTLPRRSRRLLLRLLHSFPVAVLSAPAVALILDLGGLYALYLTGLYDAAEQHPLLHEAIHAHMFAAGCLLSWALIGIDPVRRRPGAGMRLAVLVIAAAGHDVLAKLMYAWNDPSGAGPTIAARHLGAELMYYGGTVIDVALAVILMAQWYRVTGRALARARRRIEWPPPGTSASAGSAST